MDAVSTVTAVARRTRFPFIIILPSGRVREADGDVKIPTRSALPRPWLARGAPAWSAGMFRHDAAAVSLGGF
ncbi:hypothetical protein Psi01_32510 [Planobispora siamensis]|uniref:Uncharacterized protein n=1 Tax=Planobispora siamensis TaxID=936338 RepID=A0A8J3SDF1_9ACTN|nr:hypothetical protein Psi01_32510 [Planobispora siamensis]